jgi:phosphoglycerol transferase
LKRPYLPYLVTGALSFLAFFFAFKLWQADLHVPFAYAYYGDVINLKMSEMLRGGWLYWDPSLAAPFGQNTAALPQLYILNWTVRWIFLEVTRSPFMAANLFDLLAPVLNALAFLYAARRFGVSYFAAIPCAVLFGNLFTVYWRINAGHEFLASYWIVPLVCIALVQVADGVRIQRDRVGLIFVVTAVLLGLQSHYDVFFACALVVAAILIGCLQRRSMQALKTGRLFIVASVVGLVFNAAPNILYFITHRSHGATYARDPMEAYLYSLSIAQLVMPIPSHRLPIFALARERLDIIIPELINENAAATLGLIATLGLGILCVAVIARKTWKLPATLRQGGLITLAAIALATTGGVGVLFNRFITPDVRAYNRISPFIAFFCLLAVAIALDALRAYLAKRGRLSAFAVVAVVVMIFGVWDQSPAHWPPFEQSRERVAIDRVWTARIAATLPPNAAVLQLPYVSYPELPPVGNMMAQREEVPRLYSDELRWSVGTVEGTPEAQFENRLAALPPRQLVAVAMLSGFDGILIYRDALQDHGVALETALKSITRGTALVNDEGTQALFSISELRQRVKVPLDVPGAVQALSLGVDVDANPEVRRVEATL